MFKAGAARRRRPSARRATVGAESVGSSTLINKVCLSGINTIMLADLLIQSGQADIVVAGGMESMTNAPYLLPAARSGMRLGDGKVIDSMMFDGLFCAIDQIAMGGGMTTRTGPDPPTTQACGR
jgi:acetyl-CoA C-acetyltransferase